MSAGGLEEASEYNYFWVYVKGRQIYKPRGGSGHFYLNCCNYLMCGSFFVVQAEERGVNHTTVKVVWRLNATLDWW